MKITIDIPDMMYEALFYIAGNEKDDTAEDIIIDLLESSVRIQFAYNDMEIEKKQEEKYKRDHELMFGTFHSTEGKDPVMMQFYKYKEDGLMTYCYKDGEEAVVPRMVAEKWRRKGMFRYDANQDPTRYSKVQIS